MRNERYEYYLEDRDESSPSGRYTERLAQDKSLSPLAKAGIAVGALGLAVLGLRTDAGQRLMSNVGRAITDRSVMSALEKDVAEGYYRSRQMHDMIRGEIRRQKVYDYLVDEGLSEVAGALKRSEYAIDGAHTLLDINSSRLSDVIGSLNLNPAKIGRSTSQLVSDIRGAAVLTREDMAASRVQFSQHMARTKTATHLRYDKEEQSWFSNTLTKMLGLRRMTLGDVVSGDAEFDFHDIGGLKGLSMGSGGEGLRARTYRPKSSSPDDAHKEWLQLKLERMVKRDKSAANLILDKGLFISRTGETVDLRGLSQISDKIHGALSEVSLPIVGMNPYKILRVDEFRAARNAPLFEVFSETGRNHFQPVISSAEKGWRVSETLVKYGSDVYALSGLDKDPLYRNMYSSPGIRTVLSRMVAKMADIRSHESSWLDIGSKDQPSLVRRLWSKYIDDSKIINQPETLRDLYKAESGSKTSLEIIHSQYTDWVNRNTRALDDRSYGAIKKYVDRIYGEEFDLSSTDGVLSALQKIAEGTSASGQKASDLYGDRIKSTWFSYQKNPFEFLRNLEETEGSSVKKLLHKEFFSQISTHSESSNIIQQMEGNISTLYEVLDSANTSWLGKKSKDNFSSLLYSYALDRESSSVYERSAFRIAQLLQSDSIEGQQFRALSDKTHSILNPFWNIKGLGGPYPEREVYARSERILMRKAIAPWDDPVGFFKQFTAGRNNPENITTLTAPLYWTGMRTNEMLGNFGLALSNKSLGSVGQTYFNLFTKRYLPALVGLQALRYASYEFGKLTGVTPGQLGARAVAGMQLDMAHARDVMGLTERFQRWAAIRPGSIDMLRGIPGGTFLDPTMSREDVEDYLLHGNEEVRKGRWWPLGNTPFQGGAVSYYRPNSYRRAMHRPLMTDVLYGSDDEYWANSWLPTPRYPLAPIRHFITDPYHYEKKHYKDRPYLLSGGFSVIEEIPIVGPIANRLLSAILKPQEKMHKDVWRELEESQSSKNQTVFAAGMVDGEYHPDQWGPKAVGASRARRSMLQRKTPIVAVLDTGVDANHPELQGRVLNGYGYNVFTETRDTRDRQGHGTHVAGIIAARDEEGPDIAGVMPEAMILPIKVLNDFGYGTPEGVTKGIEYAINWRGPEGQKVDVINMSLGGNITSTQYSNVVKKARKAGVSVVASSGNEGAGVVSSPAYWADVMAVGAIGPDKKIASFSNYGEDLDITAPGVEIISSVPGKRGLFGLGSSHEYASYSGTSMATPHVAATAAILKAQNPSLTPEEIMYLMYNTADDLGEFGKDPLYGHGLVRADKAVAREYQLSKYNREKLRAEAARIGQEIEVRRREQLEKFRNETEKALVAANQILDPYDKEYIDPRKIIHVLGVSMRQARDIAGIYGWMVDEALGGDRRDMSRVIAQSRAMTSTRRQFWDSGIGGLGAGPLYELNEVIRRSVGKREKWEEQFNPIPNTMPSWMPGDEYFTNFRQGDPYILVPRGEERLPGAGYEAVNDVPSARMRMRGSGMGKSSKEMIRYLLHIEEEFPDFMQKILEEGTRIHDMIQAQWLEEGFAESVEGKLYDPVHDITGHYDAILRQPYGLEISDIKTLSVKRYEKLIEQDEPFRDHLEQVNFYMGTLGIDKGSLYYVMRKDLAKDKWFHFDFDPELYEHSLKKLEEARSSVRQLIDDGVISTYETYDKFERFKILADVAPYSEQYKHYAKQVAKDDSIRFQYGREDEYQRIKKQVEEKKKRLRLYPYMFKGIELDREKVTIDRFLTDTTFITKEHPGMPITLAGVNVSKGDQEAIDLIKSSIRSGKKVIIGYDSDETKRHDNDFFRSVKAVVYEEKRYKKSLTSINRQLIDKGYERKDESAAGVHAKFSPSEIAAGARWETFSHMDTPIHTKFMQIRSPIESYKRRDLYGKDWQPWTIKGVVVPTLESWYAGNPLYIGMLTFALGTTMNKNNRLKGGAILGGLGLSLATLRAINESIKGERWIPKRRRKEREIEEYFDILEYTKYKGLYEASRRRILEEEGYDIEEKYVSSENFKKWKSARLKELRAEKRDLILRDKNYKGNIEMSGDESYYDDSDYKQEIKEINKRTKRSGRARKIVPSRSRYKNDLKKINEEIRRVASLKKDSMPSSPLAEVAGEYRERYKSTLYGLDPHGPRYRIYKAIPKKDREYFDYFLNAKQDEREEILSLVPENQRGIYQSLWGMEVDQKKSLEEYFSKHYLPHPGWEGWQPDKNLKDIKVKVVQNQALDLSEFGLWKDDVKRAEYNNAPLINPGVPNYSGADLQNKLRAILEGEGLEDVVVMLQPVNTGRTKVSMDIDKDRREEIESYIEMNGLSSLI